MGDSPSKKRVALVARGAQLAGGERSLLQLAEALSPEFEPSIWHTEAGDLAEEADRRNLDRSPVPWCWPSLYRPLPLIRVIHGIRRKIEADGIDLLHINSPFEAAPFLLASRLSGRPCSVHIRMRCEHSFLHRQFLPLADAVVFNSRALLRELDWANGEVVHNGVAFPDRPSVEERQRFREELGVGEGELLLGQVGQLIGDKGFATSLEACAQLIRQGHPIRFAVVGGIHDHEPEHRQELERLAEGLGISERVRFCGFRKDASRLMAAFDLALLPTRHEAFGRVVVEALAQGVPVIASNVGGIPEILRDGVDGRLVPVGDAHALARAIGSLLENPGQRQKMGKAGKIWVEEQFGIDSHAGKMEALWRRMGAQWSMA